MSIPRLNDKSDVALPVQVARLAMLSLAAVFKDVVPGYRIRLPTDKELAMPVSKEVKRLRDYESTLLRSYQVHNALPHNVLPLPEISTIARLGMKLIDLCLTDGPWLSVSTCALTQRNWEASTVGVAMAT